MPGFEFSSGFSGFWFHWSYRVWMVIPAIWRPTGHAFINLVKVLYTSRQVNLNIGDLCLSQVFSENMGKKSEPTITKCKEKENWTRVTFKPDLAKFNMDRLEEDVVALMKKRVVDLAGTLGKSVKVELNGQRVPVKSFSDYVNLYLQSASKSHPEPLPRYI